MIVRSFLTWAATAPAAARAEGASALARAYVTDELDPGDRQDAESAFTVLLDDPSPLVRLELARELGHTTGVPRHVITALISDRSDIAALVLQASPLLGDDELIDAVAVGEAVTQSAIARRPYLTSGVAGAIAEVATLPACLVLCTNATASLAPLSLRRLLHRFGAEASMRDLLGQRSDLDAGLRHDLAIATGTALERFVVACGWLAADRAARLTRDAEEQAALTLAEGAVRLDGPAGVRRLVEHLRSTARLTPALLLRAILCGNASLFEAAVSLLSGVPESRVAGLLRGRSRLGVSALLEKAGLPLPFIPVFEIAVGEAFRGQEDGAVGLNRAIIGRVLAACIPEASDQIGKVAAMLRNLEVQAAREEARSFSVDLARDRGSSVLPRLAPRDRILPVLSAA